jgi:uncharacterized damage-inducible protein DinB
MLSEMKNLLLERQSWLIHTNIQWLRQAATLVESLSDTEYAVALPAFVPQTVGKHLRHVLEFWECFLSGLESSHIDYDARRRDLAVERSRSAALEKIESIIAGLETEPALRGDSVIWVRVEDSEGTGVPEPFLVSSVGRELQVLSSHTIHHFALIAMLLRALGVSIDPNFGMAPSTRRYLARRATAEAA